MKQFKPIPVYPLRMRGRFGLTRYIYRHGFGSVFFYTLLYGLCLLALLALSCAPAALRFWNSDMFKAVLENLKSLLRMPFSALPSSFFWTFDLPHSFSGHSGTAFILNIFATLGLGLLALGFYYFFLKPRYLGAIYNEMGGRIFGMAGSFGDICKRSGPCFKRYYTTYLAYMLGKLGAKAICSLVAQILQLMLGALAFAAAVFSLLGGGLISGAIAFLAVFLNLSVEALFSFAYPVAVNEDGKDFSALGRSIRLVWDNFWRVLGSQLLRALYTGLWSLPGVILLCIAAFNESYRLPILLCAFAWLLLVRLYFIPFRIAFNTVLYQDAISRESGAPRPQDETEAKNADTTANAAADSDMQTESVSEESGEKDEVILLPAYGKAENETEDEAGPQAEPAEQNKE